MTKQEYQHIRNLSWDLLIDANITSLPTNIIYVTEDTVTKYGLTPYATASIGGGWIVADYWWVRSPNVSNTANFVYVYSTGYPGNNNANGTNAVCPCFSI